MPEVVFKRTNPPDRLDQCPPGHWYLDHEGDAVMRDVNNYVICVGMQGGDSNGVPYVLSHKADWVKVTAYLGPPITFKLEDIPNS